jgi:hypothetical protein
MKPFPPWLQSETHHALKIGSDWQRETERQQCPWGPSLRCGWKKITGGEQHSRTPSFLGLTLLWFCWMRKGDEMPEQQTNAANGTFQMDPGRQLGTEWYSENLAVPCLVSSHSLSYNMAVCFFKFSTKMTHSHLYNACMGIKYQLFCWLGARHRFHLFSRREFYKYMIH